MITKTMHCWALQNENKHTSCRRQSGCSFRSRDVAIRFGIRTSGWKKLFFYFFEFQLSVQKKLILLDFFSWFSRFAWFAVICCNLLQFAIGKRCLNSLGFKRTGLIQRLRSQFATDPKLKKTGKTSNFKPGKVFSDATLSSVNRTIEKCLSYTNFVFVQSWYHQNLLQSHLEQCHSSNDIRKVTDCRRPCHTPARCSNDEVKWIGCKYLDSLTVLSPSF